jgi:prepilin-type N-terminal cleavage/methylation domain-containing protein
MIKERQVEQTMNALLNKKGFTLVEVMIALVVTLVVFLALMQTALVGIDSNMRNILRDEAVSLAEQRMNELRNTVFTAVIDTNGISNNPGNYVDETPIPRDFRNFSLNFTPARRVDDLNTDNKQIDIRVTWAWKGETYTHSITTILRGQ